MARLLESFGRLVRVLLQGIKEVVTWLCHAHSDYFGHDVTNSSIVPALVWCSKENEEAGRPDDRFV